MTYGELNRRANQLAHHLRALGVRPETLVGICVERSLEMLVGILGILKAGGAYVPVDPAYPAERQAFMLEDARVPILVTQAALAGELHAPNGVTVCLDTDWDLIAQQPDSNPERLAQPGNTAYVIYTSGTTGRPKGVMITHANVARLFTATDHWFSFSGSDTWTLFHSFAFDFSVWEIWGALFYGGRLVVVPRITAQSPEQFHELLVQHKVTVLNQTPSAFRQLISADERSGRSCELALKWVIFGGEALEFKTLLPWTLRHGDTPALINMYGITETTVHVTYYKVTAAEVAESATSLVGVPIPDLQVYILDRDRRLLPAGVTGEMYVGGGGVAREYLNRPELTAERFIPDPFSPEPSARLYKTGDLGRFRSDGNIQHMGRADSQVKIRGFRIELGEIENTLRRHSAVSDCVVVAREDQPGDKRLVAYIVASVDSTPDVKEIRAHLGSSLPEYMVPAAMMLLDELPLTSSGKIDSKALPAPDYAAGQSDIDGGAPETAVQQIVAAIWSEVLKLDRIALGNDFFQIGGHSLLATQVIARVRQAFGVDVPLRCLFETPTLRDMCAEVDRLLQAGRMSESPALTKVDRSVPLRLSFAQQRFWLMNQLNPNDTGYNVKTAIRMIGALDIAVLQECITEIFSRNEVLRTTYRGTGGVPTQVIQPATPAQLEIVDIEGTGVDEALRIAAVAALKPFDLAAGPVCRFYLYRIGARDHILVMVTHHIAMDGSSTSIVFEDLGNLYSQLCAGERPRLEEKTFDYADFSAWQRQWMQGDVLGEHLSFWRGHLDGLPPHMELPTDRSVETSSGAGDARSFRMSPEFFEQLTEFCRTHRVTQFTVMLWSLGILLHRWSGGKSFAIGTVAGNRPVAGLERVVGCFLNMLPLRMDVHSSDSALDVLARTRTTVLDGFSHAQCPFEAIVEAMKVERSAHRNPVFNVGLLLQNFSEMAFVTESLDAKAIGFERETALLDLRFVASIRADKAVIGCEYKRDLFDPETIDLLLEAYAAIVQALIADPGMEVDAVPVSPALLAQAENANAEHHQKIIVSATFTAEPIEEPLRFWMRELELNYEIEFAPYNQVFQSLLDPESAMRRNKNGFNVLLVRFEDWAQFDGSGAETARENIRRENIRNSVEEMISAVKSAAAGNFASCILCCCPASRSLASDPEWAAFLLEMEEHVASDLIKTSGVHVITSAHLNDMYPVAEYEDKYADAVAHVPYTKAFSTALATIVIRRISGLRGAQYKVVALDCDNTLWQGICGEDGAFGVTIDTPHRALQDFIQKQREQGMLVCLCSKNNEQDVWDVFQQNAGMLLRREDITGHRINWERKSENLKSLAQELGLGLDSFVFLDDSPVECAEVETECPEVLTLQIPEQVHQLPAFLKHMWAFDHFQSTEVDRRRSELYRDNREREELRKGQGLDEFIESLQLEIDIAPLSEENVARVAQLTQRTNQFNFTTIRRQEHEVGEILNMPAMECLTVHVRDRFGDYGLVGAVIYSFDEGSLVVDTMLLSCRALGRRVEHAILDRLGEEARKKNMDRLDMRFSRTAKNTPAFDFLESLQDATKVSEAGGIVYRMGLIGVSENGMDQLVDAL
ncbi:MAG: amino acid adenylation domain-containing protein [Acidobacteriota bacterium]|nr:amino acid adenylation domain-containing protein [Acidobacteriota bacterium]